jgi:hypothetical protein
MLPTTTLAPINTLIPTITPIYAETNTPKPIVTSTPYFRPTSTSSVPIDMSCWTNPSQVSLGSSGTLTVYGQLKQGGSIILGVGLEEQWYDGSHIGHCTAVGGIIGAISCQGHYWGLLAHRSVIVNVGLGFQDGRRFSCQTTYNTP